jgi:hypothetical protein
VGETRRQPAQYISAAAAVAMHDIGALVADELAQPIRERQVEIAGTKQVLHANAVLPGHGVDARVGRADENVLHAPLIQGIEQVNHLLRSAQKMAPGFHMQYFHKGDSLLISRWK